MLHYKIYGSGPPIIILHGLFGMGDNWQTVARMLESRFQCIVPDLRNHGRSPHDDEMNFEVMAEDIHELMAILHLESAALMGHSLGGKVAMRFTLTYPQKVDKLIVVDMAPKYYPPHHNIVIDALQSIDPHQLNSRAEAETALEEWLGNDQSTIQFLMKNLNRRTQGGFEWKANMAGIIRAYNQLNEKIPFSDTYEGPVMFIRGQRSGYILDEDMSLIRQLFPQAELSTIPDAGHWVHADAPEAFVAEIRPFLES